MATIYKNNSGLIAKTKVSKYNKGLCLTEKLVPKNPLLFLYKTVVSKLITNMKIKNFVIVFLVFMFHSCDKMTENTTKGLYKMTDNWIQKESTYWIEKKLDSSFSQVKSIDTLQHKNFRVCEIFEFSPNETLSVEKMILINSSSKKKISETDVYSKKLNEYIISELNLTYDYKSKEYSIIMLDSLATEEKLNANKIKYDSMYKYAEKHNIYLCGTVANQILYEDVPEFPSIKEMNIDSALIIIEKWKTE